MFKILIVLLFLSEVVSVDCTEECKGNAAQSEDCSECCSYGLYEYFNGYGPVTGCSGCYNGTGEHAACCINGGSSDCGAYCQLGGSGDGCQCLAGVTYSLCCGGSLSKLCSGYCSYQCGECAVNGKGGNLCGTGRICTGATAADECRSLGSGLAEQGCGLTGDAPCRANLGLACSYSTDYNYNVCKGNGSAGFHCSPNGYGPDDNCGVSLTCDEKTSLCRAVGDGNDGAGCGTSDDAPCEHECDRGTRKCRAKGNGVDGAGCNGLGGQQFDESCNPNLVCDSNTSTCRAAGDGGVNAKCGSSGDSSCSGLICDMVDRTCRAAGTGGNGQPCFQQGDDNCIYSTSNPLFCDYDTNKCRAPGDGSYGADCHPNGRYGAYSEKPCKTGLVCLYRKCVGTGVNGAGCGGENDAPCDGTECISNICGGGGGGAPKDGAFLLKISNLLIVLLFGVLLL